MEAEQGCSRESGLVPQLLIGLVKWVCRFPRLVLTASLLLSAASLYAFNHSLEYRTQRSDLISPNKDYHKRWREYLAEFGNDDDIVVVVQGSNRQQMQQALEALAARVQEQPA